MFESVYEIFSSDKRDTRAHGIGGLDEPSVKNTVSRTSVVKFCVQGPGPESALRSAF